MSLEASLESLKVKLESPPSKLKRKRLSESVRSFLENPDDDVDKFDEMSDSDKRTLIMLGRPRLVFDELIKIVGNKVYDDIGDDEFTESDVEELFNENLNNELDKFIKSYNVKVFLQSNRDIFDITNSPTPKTKDELIKLDENGRRMALQAGYPKIIADQISRRVNYIISTLDSVNTFKDDKSRRSYTVSIRNKEIEKVLDTFLSKKQLTKKKKKLLDHSKFIESTIADDLVIDKPYADDVKELKSEYGKKYRATAYDGDKSIRIAEPVLMIVTVMSHGDNVVTVTQGYPVMTIDYTDNIRFTAYTNIYDSNLRKFLSIVNPVRDGSHDYKGYMSFKEFKLFSESFLGSAFANDEKFFNSRMFGIDIYTKGGDISKMFDSYVEDNDRLYLSIKPEKFMKLSKEEMKLILERMYLYKFVPMVLPYDKFDTNGPSNIRYDYGNCVVRMLVNMYTNVNSVSKNGKGLSERTIINHFKTFTAKELFSFVEKYNINTTIIDVFGNKIYKHRIPKEKMKGRKKDLTFMWFDEHSYPYTGKMSLGSNPDMTISSYNDNLFISGCDSWCRDEGMSKCKLEFSKEFTSNFSYLSDIHCSKSIRYCRDFEPNYLCADVNDLVLNRDYNGDDCKLYEYRFNDMYSSDLIEYGGKTLLEVDMKKAFHSVMFNLMDRHVEIPVFAVTSMVEEYVNDAKIRNSYMYYLSEECLSRTSEMYGLYSNYTHGFVVNHLLNNGVITKKDITHFKSYSKLYNLNDFMLKVEEIIVNCGIDVGEAEEVKGKIAREIVELYNSSDSDCEKNIKIAELCKKHCNTVTFKDSYMIMNGIAGMNCTRNKQISVRVNRERLDNNMTVLNMCNDGLIVSDIYREDGVTCDDEYVKVTKTLHGKHKYFNNRNIYDYCISATNLMMMRALDQFRKYNPKLDIVRINTDCITFLVDGKSNIVLTKFINDNFKFKTVCYDVVVKSSIETRYDDPNVVIEGVNNELLQMHKNTICYTGGPGTGKTHTVKNDHSYDFAMTISNVCCRNMDNEKVRADTIYSHLQLYDTDISIGKRLRKFYNKTVWFDEFSMFNADYFNYIFLLTNMKNCKIIISGDHNQIPPIKDRKSERTIDINNNRFFHFLFSNGEHFTENRRLNNSQDGEMLMKLLDDLRENLNDKVKCTDIAKSFKNNIYSYRLEYIKTHITHSRKMRHMINNYIYDKLGHSFCYLDDGSIRLTKGLRLIVSDSYKKYELYKSMIYEVPEDIYVTKEEVMLYNVTLCKMEPVKSKLLKNMSLGFAITCHASQGLTIRKSCCIHEYASMIKYDTRILYTAVSRLTSYNDIIIVKNSLSYRDSAFYLDKDKKESVLYDVMCIRHMKPGPPTYYITYVESTYTGTDFFVMKVWKNYHNEDNPYSELSDYYNTCTQHYFTELRLKFALTKEEVLKKIEFIKRDSVERYGFVFI